jgi:iojap-like ribosome-associated protein
MNEFKNLPFVITTIEEKKVPVLVTYDVRPLSTFADVFVIALANNDRQISAIVDEFREQTPDKTAATLTIEGNPKDGWVAIQFEEICAHIFLPTEHESYHLDDLFKEMPVIEV